VRGTVRVVNITTNVFIQRLQTFLSRFWRY